MCDKYVLMHVGFATYRRFLTEKIKEQKVFQSHSLPIIPELSTKLFWNYPWSCPQNCLWNCAQKLFLAMVEIAAMLDAGAAKAMLGVEATLGQQKLC